MSTTRQTLLFCGAVWLIHALLVAQLDGLALVERLLSADGLGTAALPLALLLLALRLLQFFVVPGLMLALVIHEALRWRRAATPR